MSLTESSNHRPGEPLRSWLARTEVVRADAIFTIQMAHAHDALRRIIDGDPLANEDLIALGRLNSYCVARWYEPMVTLMREAHIDPELARFLSPLIDEAR